MTSCYRTSLEEEGVGDFLEKLPAGALSTLLMEAGSSGSDGFDIMTSEVIKKSTVCVCVRESICTCVHACTCVHVGQLVGSGSLL